MRCLPQVLNKFWNWNTWSVIKIFDKLLKKHSIFVFQRSSTVIVTAFFATGDRVEYKCFGNALVLHVQPYKKKFTWCARGVRCIPKVLNRFPNCNFWCVSRIIHKFWEKHSNIHFPTSIVRIHRVYGSHFCDRRPIWVKIIGAAINQVQQSAWKSNADLEACLKWIKSSSVQSVPSEVTTNFSYPFICDTKS